MKKINYKFSFLLLVISFSVFAVAFRIHAMITAASLLPDAINAATDNLWCTLILVVLLVVWWLPLAVLTNQSVPVSNKPMRIILKVIIVYLSICLLVSPFRFVRYF